MEDTFVCVTKLSIYFKILDTNVLGVYSGHTHHTSFRMPQSTGLRCPLNYCSPLATASRTPLWPLQGWSKPMHRSGLKLTEVMWAAFLVQEHSSSKSLRYLTSLTVHLRPAFTQNWITFQKPTLWTVHNICTFFLFDKQMANYNMNEKKKYSTP